MNPLNGHLPLIRGETEAQRGSSSPRWLSISDTEPGLDLGLLTQSTLLQVVSHPAMLAPSLALPVPRTGIPRGERGLFPMMTLAIPIMSSLPRKESLHWIVLSPLPTGQAAEPCIYVHTQCLSPASSMSLPLHRPGKETGHAKAGLTPPTECSTPPCQPASDPCVSSTPETQGASGQKAGVGFALFCSLDSISLLHRFPLAPVRGWGWGKGQIYAAIFIHSQFRVGSGLSARTLTIHSPSAPTSWVSLCMFPSQWWEIV